MAETLPTRPELKRWYRHLQKVGTFEMRDGGQAFFYEGCWITDLEIHQVWIAWEMPINRENLPSGRFEEALVQAGRFDELYKFLRA